MKLSEKGLQKLDDAITFEVCQWDVDETKDEWANIKFKQEDFKDCVVLTIKEAKEIYEALDECLDLSIGEVEGSEPRFNAERLIRERFKERIKQAEKSE